MEIRVDIEDKGVLAMLAEIKQRAGTLLPAMKIIGEIVRRSVQVFPAGAGMNHILP